MPNVTIELDERLLRASREHAQRHGITLEALIGELLEERIKASRRDSLQAFFDAADKTPGHSHGWKWNREEIYEHLYKRGDKE